MNNRTVTITTDRRGLSRKALHRYMFAIPALLIVAFLAYSMCSSLIDIKIYLAMYSKESTTAVFFAGYIALLVTAVCLLVAIVMLVEILTNWLKGTIEKNN